MTKPLKLLVAEDNPQDAELLLRALRRAGYEPQWTRVETETDFLDSLHAGLDLVISDYSMPQFTGLRALELTMARHPEIPFIVVSGTIGEETAVEAMRLGATDYLMKDRLARLGSAVDRALESGRLRRERQQGELALKHSEEKLRMVTDNARVGLVMINSERCYAFANDTYAEILGLDASKLIGRRVAEVLASLYEDQIRPRLDRAMAGERVAHELTRPVPGGRRHYAVRYEPTRMVGEVSLVVMVLTDITERKEADEQIREQLAELLRWQSIMMGREDRIQALKQEVNELLAQLQRPPRYGKANPLPDESTPA